MKFNSFKFLLFLLTIGGLILCASVGCNPDEEVPEEFDEEVLIQMQKDIWPALDYDRIFVSDKKGKLLDCRYDFWPYSTPIEFVNEIPLENDHMDLTFTDYPIPELNKYRLFTYSNIKRKEWTLHQYKRAVGTGGANQYPVFWKPGTGFSPETYLIYNSCSRNSIQLYEWLLVDDPYLQTQVYCNNLLVLAYEPDGSISYNLFPNTVINDSIPLNFDNFTPLNIADLNTTVQGDIRVKGITGLWEKDKIEFSTKYYDPGFYSNFTTTPYGDLNDGQIIFPENIFEEFLVDLEITSTKIDYHLTHNGDPIYEYSPTPPLFTMDGSDINSFIVSPNGDDADFYGITWEVKNENFDIEWTVYQEKNQTEKLTLPEMPSCVIQIQDKLSRSDFKLKSIEGHYYENFESLEDFINNRFDPDTGIEGFELTIKGGRYEKKTIRP